MKLAIMQPYFLPYIGYFQLIGAVDTFVIYDNIKYTKKGWVNRNRMLRNGEDVTFSLPLAKDSDSLDIVQRELAADFGREKLLNQFKGAYAKAPYFDATFPLLARIVLNKERNLFRYIHQSVAELCGHLDLKTEIRVSSEIDIDHDLKSQAKVLALCKALDADTYINAIGGLDLYRREDFGLQGIELQFIRAKLFEYPQFGAPTVPWLSIVDVLMFNPLNVVQDCITIGYEII
jgi:WbqC-like protein family